MAKAQTTGRIGELSVELELTSRNWLVGNFNSNIQIVKKLIPFSRY